MLIPPISEQNQIVDQIRKQFDCFEDLINKNQTQIEKLREYRQSLISEAVTGKIDVREWQKPEPLLS